MVYVLYGEDSYTCHQALNEIKKGLGDPQLLEPNTSVLSGQEVTPRQIAAAGQSLPFFSDHRLVIIEGLLERFEPGRGGRPKDPEKVRAEAGTFAASLKDLTATTTLILVDGEIKPGNPLLKALSPGADVRAFHPLRDPALRDWLKAEVARKGGSISPGAVELLMELVGADLWAQGNEIEKLLLHAQGRPIEERDVEQVVTYAREANIFHLVDALLEGRTAQAGSWLHQLLAEGTEPTNIIALIARQLRLIVKAQGLLSQRGLSADEMRQRLGVTGKFPLGRLLGQARQYPLPRLSRVYKRVLEADLAIKTGKYKGELALDLLTAELSRA